MIHKPFLEEGVQSVAKPGFVAQNQVAIHQRAQQTHMS